MRMHNRTLPALAAALAVLAACQDQPVSLDPVSAVRVAGAASARCDASPDFTASTQAELLAAAAAAGPGDVIGINGTIELTQTVVLGTADVTLTCASGGAGIRAGVVDSFSVAPVYLVSAEADGITVSGLRLDGSGIAGAPFIAFTQDQSALHGVRLLGNDMICGDQNCGFFIGVAGAQVVGNHIQSNGSGSGIHMQGSGELVDLVFQNRIDGSVVSRNTIVATVPTAFPNFGGVRVRDGASVTVSHNEITGPWRNSVAVAELDGSAVEQNRIDGAASFGILVGSAPFRLVSVSTTLFRGNTISGSGLAAVNVRRACYNTFQGNNLNANPARKFNFEPTTGANTYRGNGEQVVDNGRFDCDGDGDIDPNVITGGSVITTPDGAQHFSVSAAETGGLVGSSGGRGVPSAL